MEELSCLSFIAGEKGCGSPLSTTRIEEEEYLTGTVPMPNQEENSGGIDTSLDLPREDGDVKNTSSLPLIAQHKALEQENGSIPPKSLPIAICSLVPAQPVCSSPTATVDQAVVNNKRPQKVHYPVMIRRAMENARHPQGICSLQAIRRDILELFPETQTKHKACKKLIADGVLVKITPSTFKFAQGYFNSKGLNPQSSNRGGQSRLSFNGITELANQSILDHNKKMREEMVGASRRKRIFLLRNKALVMPFMSDEGSGNVFFDAIEEEIKKIESASKPFQSVTVGKPGGGVGGTCLEIDYRALPVNEQFATKLVIDERLLPVIATKVLSRLGQFRLEEIGRGKPSVTMTGKCCREYPPLQLDCNYQLTMSDAKDLNMKINDCGVFSGMYVAWPGQRLEISSKDSICKDGTFMLPGNSFEPPKEVIIDWKYVYWLEKREEVTIKPQWGPCGWRYPNNTAALCDGTDETTQHVFDNVSPEKLPPPPTQKHIRITSRTTGLRLSNGVFIHHPILAMKRSQEYARRGNIPVMNLVMFHCISPISGVPIVVSRQFCTDYVYIKTFKKLLRDIIKRNPEGVSVIKEIVPSAIRSTSVHKPSQSSHISHQTTPVLAATAASPPLVASALTASCSSAVENPTTTKTISSPAPSPHKHTTMAAPQSMSSEELAALSSTEKLDAIRAAAKWVEKAHAPLPTTVLEEGTQAVIDYYTQLLDSVANLPVDAVLLSTVEARLNHSLYLLVQERCEKESTVNAAANGVPPVKKVEEEANLNGHPSIVAPADPLAEESKVSGSTTTSLPHAQAQAMANSEAEDPAIPSVELKLLHDPESTLRDVEILSVPSSIKATLHKYQVEGLSWLMYMYEEGMPAILGDQMGLGKTLQSIALMAALKESDVNGPHLIVAPLSVLSNWINELNRFCPSLRLVRFHGPKGERNRIKTEELHDLQEFDVVVTTYEMVVAESTFFQRRFIWRLLVVDEGHRLKNEKSQLSTKLSMVHAYCRILLTGTPVQNNLREVWALLHFILPDVFSSSNAIKFEEGFDLAKGFCDTNRMQEARGLLSKLMLRRVKDQVSISLPPCTEIQLLVKLTQVQHNVYKHLLVNQDRSILQAILEAEEGGEGDGESSRSGQNGYSAAGKVDVDYRSLMNLLMQLRKVCNHPYLLCGEDGYDPSDVDALVSMSGKLVVLDRILPKLKADGHRILIFTQFTSMLDILAEFLVARGYDYCRLDGSTNRVQRHLDIRRFNAPASPVFAFLISTRAGGLGINLASADTVILYDSDWNPQSDLQAMERAHRIGQTKPVRVYRLLCRGSIEERMVSRASKKLFLNAMVAEKQQGTADEDAGGNSVENGGLTGMPGIDKREIASMLKFGASAVFASGKEDISDEELDVLLGRVDEATSNGKVNMVSSECMSGISGQALAESLLMGSAGSMEEESMRKLEGVEYMKLSTKKDKHSSFYDTPLTEGKRKRYSRVVMMDVNEPGLEEGVAVLVDSLHNGLQSLVVHSRPPKRVRKWEHQNKCLICGEGNNEEELVKCGYCPRVYHASCMIRTGIKYSSAGSLVCPQHRCVGCDRTTTAAGGLLFRCLTCTSAFCEDCLLEDDIESYGRSAVLEALGYRASQAYWIKCERCSESGLNITGGTGDDNATTVDSDTVQGQFDVSSSTVQQDNG